METRHDSASGPGEPSRPGSRSAGVRTGLVVSALLAFVLPADAAVSAEAVCRRKIGLGVRKLVDQALKQKVACYRRQLLSRVPPTVDCNDLDDPGFPGRRQMANARARLQDLVAAGCAQVDLPAARGFVACPAPCQAISIIGYSGPSSVAACLRCLAEARVEDAVGTVYGQPPPSDKAMHACQMRIGDGLRTYTIARMKQQQRCQAKQDTQNTGVDCSVIGPASDPDGKVQKVRAKMHRSVAECALPALAALDTCDDTITGEQECVRAAAEACADGLFREVYETSNDAVFVSGREGSDGGAGTIDDPVATIGAGLAIAETRGAANVAIDGGNYAESVTLVGGVSLLGGFDARDSWRRSGLVTRIIGGSTAVLGTGVADLVMDGLDVEAADNPAPSGSSYGLRLVDSSGVIFQNGTITAGAGGDGSPATAGRAGAGGDGGGVGGAGCSIQPPGPNAGCPPCLPGAKAAGGLGVACPFGGASGAGGAGGMGNRCPTPGSPGLSGDGGLPGGAGGASGGPSCGSIAGAAGGLGVGPPSSGALGFDGAGGRDFGGGVDSYAPAPGDAGAHGAPGDGGSGGGGGGGGGGTWWINWGLGGTEIDTCHFSGGGGGGGGSGGCGGEGGRAGAGGGGSFGVWLSSSHLVALGATINTGRGGAGGDGGVGGAGGLGGTGGTGGAAGDMAPFGLVSSSHRSGGAGGNGRSGGRGGDGGAGGGGGGGPSIGAVCANGSTLALSGSDFNLGAPGVGGASPGGPAGVGATGRVAGTEGC